MSPLKISIATFVVGLIGLTASAMNETGSKTERKISRLQAGAQAEQPVGTQVEQLVGTQAGQLVGAQAGQLDRAQLGQQRSRSSPEHGSSSGSRLNYGARFTEITDGPEKSHIFLYKPVSEDIEMQDVGEFLEYEELRLYKKLLVFVHMYDINRQDYCLDGTLRTRTLPSREKLLNGISLYEEKVRKKKLESQEAERPRAQEGQQRSRSTREHGSSPESQPAMYETRSSLRVVRGSADSTRIVGDGGLDFPFVYKPVSHDIELQDLVAVYKPDQMRAYKRALTQLHMYDNNRQDFKINGSPRVKELASRSVWIDRILHYEERARRNKLKKQEAKRAGAQVEQPDGAQAEQPDGAQAGQLHGEQAEQQYGSQAGQLDRAEAARERVRSQRANARARARKRTAAKAQAGQLVGAQAIQLDGAEAEAEELDLGNEERDRAQAGQQYGAQAMQLDGAEAEVEELDLFKEERDRRIRALFGEDTPSNSNSSSPGDL